METSYPVFESGQVLTSRHLNDLVDYLEEQDRLTRNKLIGIGICCGLEVGYESKQNRIRIGSGCAVTSQGYLIVHDECVVDRFRDYVVPVSELEEPPGGGAEEGQRYHFFFDSNGNQVPLWELLPTAHTSAPGELPPTAISEEFLADKVVMLFLERNVESLKNCDISDCSDKGAEVEFTLRRLLVRVDDAKLILGKEEAIAQRPVDMHRHPKWDLHEVDIEKINPAAHSITTFHELTDRVHNIMAAIPELDEQLKSSYEAFKYLLAEMYPAPRFPNGPFGSGGYLENVMRQYQNNVFLVQHLYDYLYDLAQAYREFLRSAFELVAECCPNPDRFPRHVLLGLVKESNAAFAPRGGRLGSTDSIDPLSADSGFGAQQKPAAYRHHFIPSMLFDRQHARFRRVRSLHYRMYLLAYRYSAGGLMETDIRITPSKEGDYALSEKSIPFYYAFAPEDDLHRNWSYARTTGNRLSQVFSHQLIDDADHPWKYRRDDHNFYRVEGVVGKSLRQAMSDLLEQKRKLGLSFAIEPVYMGVTERDDLDSRVLDTEARERAQEALKKILLCRMRDLDVVFLVLMAALFYYLYIIIYLLSRGNTTAVAGMTTTARTRDAGDIGALRTGLLRAQPVLRRIRTDVDRSEADTVLRDIRPEIYRKGDVTKRVTKEKDPARSIGALYSKVKDAPTTSNLFDRTVVFASDLDPNADAEAVARRLYPTLSLLDKTEELVDVVSASSLSEFDHRLFEAKYEGFVNSFDDYLAAEEKDEDKEATEVVETKEMLATTYSAVAATGPQSIVNNLGSELQERIQNVFSELQLEGYAKRHPGMEHKCGVPVGGTLILLYAHKQFVARVLGRNQKRYSERIKEMRANMRLDRRNTGFTDAEKIFAIASTADPTDDFVVLADFCVPYLCCDTDCGDIILEQEEVEEAPPVLVRGRVFGVGDRPVVLTRTQVTATYLDTNQPVEVTREGEEFVFQGAAGSYRIEAKARGFRPGEQTVSVAAGATRRVNFALERLQ